MTFSNAQSFFHLVGFAGLFVACTATIDGEAVDPDGGADGYGGSAAQGGAIGTGGATSLGGTGPSGGTGLGGTGLGGTGLGGTALGGTAGLGGTALGGTAGLGGTALGGTAGLGGTALGGTAGVAGTATGGTATGGTATGGTATGGAGGGSTVPFSAVSSIIVTRCASSTCHGGRRNPNLTAANLYATLTATAVRQCGSDRLVTPSDPANSALLELVNGLCGTFIMPDTCRTAPCLPAAETQTITAWIQAGAHNP